MHKWLSNSRFQKTQTFNIFSFWVFPMFSSNKRWWRLHAFSFLGRRTIESRVVPQPKGRLRHFSLHFQNYQSLLSCRDNQGHLLSLHFQDYQSLVSCRDNQGHLLLYILKTSMSFVKTIIVFFTFPWLSESFVSRLSQTSLLFQDYWSLLPCGDYQCLPLFTFSNTLRVFCFKDYQSLPLRLQCLLYFAKLQGLSFDIPDAYYTPLLTGFTVWVPLMVDRMARSLGWNSCPYLYIPFHFQRKGK